MCLGMQSGIEAAAHATNQIANENNNNEHFSTILVDSNNSFNQNNRKDVLHTLRHRWPSASRLVYNLWKGHSLLFVHGSDHVIHSQEGNTQGCSSAMHGHGLAVLPLIESVPKLNNDTW